LTSVQLAALPGARDFLKNENFRYVGALDAMDSVKRNRFVPMRNQNILADGLRMSLGELTLSILRRHIAEFFALRDEEIVQAIHSSMMARFSSKHEPQLVGNQVGVGLTKGNVEWLQPGHSWQD
jgi:hypothetical protein